MMKLLIPLLSFLIGNAKGLFKEPGEAITQQVILKIRSITTVLVITIASLVLSCVGISLSVNKLASQLDTEGSLAWTPGFLVYLGLTVLSLGTLFYILRRETWLQKIERHNGSSSSSRPTGRPIENALALLLMDFLEERKERRKKE